MKGSWAYLCVILVLLVEAIIAASGSILFGFTTNDGSYLSADSMYSGGGGLVMKEDVDWITPLGSNMIVGIIGDVSDCDALRSQLQQAHEEHCLAYGDRSMSCRAMANLCRNLIAEKLRSQSPLNVDVLLAGCNDMPFRKRSRRNIATPSAGEREEGGGSFKDDKEKEKDDPELYWLDGIGSLQKVAYGAHGRDVPLVLSSLDSLLGTSGPGRERDSVSDGDSKRDSRLEGEEHKKEKHEIEKAKSSGGDGNDEKEKQALGALQIAGKVWGTVRVRSAGHTSSGRCQVRGVHRSDGVLRMKDL